MAWDGMALAVRSVSLLWRSICAAPGEKWAGVWELQASSWDKTAYLLQHAKGSISKGRCSGSSTTSHIDPALLLAPRNQKTETEP